MRHSWGRDVCDFSGVPMGPEDCEHGFAAAKTGHDFTQIRLCPAAPVQLDPVTGAEEGCEDAHGGVVHFDMGRGISTPGTWKRLIDDAEALPELTSAVALRFPGDLASCARKPFRVRPSRLRSVHGARPQRLFRLTQNGAAPAKCLRGPPQSAQSASRIQS